jgi:hypothetical protein
MGITIPCLEEDMSIVLLMFHGGLGACVDARVEVLFHVIPCSEEDMSIVLLMFYEGLVCVD